MTATALVVGSGPAGLMAADALAERNITVTVAEAKPSISRKLLMAGKSGLNITKDENPDAFRAAYGTAAESLGPMLAEFGPQEAKDWAKTLEQPIFTGSSGRVFPVSMKASPLLRAWAARLGELDVRVETRWRWIGWGEDGAHHIDTPEGPRHLRPSVTVLALGGASWARLGSDGAWIHPFRAAGIPLAPFRPANVGICVDWSPQMKAQAGAPLKSCIFMAGGTVIRGEAVVSRVGLEGSAIYALSPALRDGAPLTIDLAPDLTVDALTKRLSRPRGKQSLANHLRKALNLPKVKTTLLREVIPLPDEPAALAARIKAVRVAHTGARPMDEAISVAGGVTWDAVTDELMLKARPGTFVAGEMLDWEAPTGGYLITGCLASGLCAGRAAASYAMEA